MRATPQGLPEVLEITPVRHQDDRGYLSETYNKQKFAEAGIDISFVQDNHSFSISRGVLRGLHFQLPPFAQDKLVRVVKGAIFDVAIDIRKGSPRFAQWCPLVVSAEKWNQIFIPKGFAHGFLTLEANTEVIYKVSAPYAPQHDRVVHFADPTIGIEWPLEKEELILSAKDCNAPSLQDVDTGFEYRADREAVT